MDIVSCGDKLKRVLEYCFASEVISEHARSVITERLYDALSTGKAFHEQSVTDAIDVHHKNQKYLTATPNACYLHIDLKTGTCSWLTILKDEENVRYQILASTFAARKNAWRSSGVHGWCETHFNKLDDALCFYFDNRAYSVWKSLFTSLTHSCVLRICDECVPFILRQSPWIVSFSLNPSPSP